MTTRTGFTLPDELFAALNEYARESGTPASQIMRLALADYLERKGFRALPVAVQWGGDMRGRNEEDHDG